MGHYRIGYLAIVALGALLLADGSARAQQKTNAAESLLSQCQASLPSMRRSCCR